MIEKVSIDPEKETGMFLKMIWLINLLMTQISGFFLEKG
jgi:hypothetical protein